MATHTRVAFSYAGYAQKHDACVILRIRTCAVKWVYFETSRLRLYVSHGRRRTCASISASTLLTMLRSAYSLAVTCGAILNPCSSER
eukprot:3961190-Pleurochrysis_carterae.AAC.1